MITLILLAASAQWKPVLYELVTLALIRNSPAINNMSESDLKYREHGLVKGSIVGLCRVGRNWKGTWS